MSDINEVTIIGRLGADPEVKRTAQGSPVANFRLAVSETWRDKNSGERKEKTEWIPVVVWNEGLCKITEQYLKKGSRVFVRGKWQTRKWQDQNGNDRYSTECVLQGFDAKLQMLDPKDRGDDMNRRQEDMSGMDHDHQSGAHYRDSYGNQPADFSDEIPFLMEWRG